MYFGSVRFFKHLIYLTMGLASVVVLSGLCLLGSLLVDSLFQVQVEAVDPRNNSMNKDPVTFQDTNVPEGDTMPAIPKWDYQLDYPELYSRMPEQFTYKEKVAYLTFDDGPSNRTLEILDILKEYDIRATFFVVTENANPEILRRIVAEGHAIGVHTHSHIYSEIYKSVESYLKDFSTAYNIIYEATSLEPRIFRFPGGSINAYNSGIYQELIAEMLRRGFIYFDWNVSTMDTKSDITADEIVDIIKMTVRGQKRVVILAHDSDTRYETVKALPEIIEFLSDAGYSFETCDNYVEPVVFAYPKHWN